MAPKSYRRPKTEKRVNARDATERNVRASGARDRVLLAHVRNLTKRVRALELLVAQGRRGNVHRPVTTVRKIR